MLKKLKILKKLKRPKELKRLKIVNIRLKKRGTFKKCPRGQIPKNLKWIHHHQIWSWALLQSWPWKIMRAGMMILRAGVLLKRSNKPKRSMEKFKEIRSIEKSLRERG
jgi:hypothetical protein